MKYNAKYDRWVSKEGLVYRYDEQNDKLVLANMCKSGTGYVVHRICKAGKSFGILIHRLVWETFKYEIPDGMVIDHINTIKDDNHLENLRCVSQKENLHNPITIKRMKEAQKGKTMSKEAREKISSSLKGKAPGNKGKYTSVFSLKFIEHFNMKPDEDWKLWNREHTYWFTHNKVCRWEVEDKCKS